MVGSPLFRRLFVAVALLALLPLLATALGAALLVRSEARDETEERLRSDATLAREMAQPIFRDGAALDRLAKKLAAEIHARLTFVDGAGRVLGDSDHDPTTMENHGERPEIRAARETGVGVALRRSDTLGLEMVYVAIRAEPDDPASGTVRAALPLAVLEGELKALYLRLALIAAPFGIAALISAAIAFGAFSRAVHDLTDAAQAVAAGYPARRTEAEEREDEVGDLARAVRAMGDELSLQVRTIASERKQLETVVGALDEGLLAADRAGEILLFNDAARRLLGVAAAPPVGSALVDAVPHGIIVEVARRALEDGAPGERTVDVFGPDGAEARSLEVRATPFGVRAGVVVLLHDVTEARRYDRLRRDFVANVSHELRTPLALVKGFLETLEDGALRDPERGPRFLAILRTHVDGLERLVADLLTLSALEAGGEARPLEPIPLAPAVESVLVPFADAFAKRRLTVTRRVPESLPPVAGHRDHVERAIRNLVDNAAKFTPEGGAIAIEASAAAGAVSLEVRDSGPGIPFDHLERIFERFYRVERSRAREGGGGTGLGLAIVKHIMQQEGGSVAVKSPPGGGSAFTLVFRAFAGG